MGALELDRVVAVVGLDGGRVGPLLRVVRVDEGVGVVRACVDDCRVLGLREARIVGCIIRLHEEGHMVLR